MYRAIETTGLHIVLPDSVWDPEIDDRDSCEFIEWVGIDKLDVDAETQVTSVELPPMKLSQRALLLLPIGHARLKLRITHDAGPAIQIDGLANKSGDGIAARVVSKTNPTIEAWTRAGSDLHHAVRAVTRSASQGAALRWEIIGSITGIDSGAEAAE